MTAMQVTLKIASAAQKTSAQKQRSAEWARWLSTDDYVRKWEDWDTREHANEGKLVTWVLVPTDNTETLDLLSIYQRDVLVLEANTTKSILSIGYAIASVFTPTQLRGNGYARRMMSLLHFTIAQPGSVPTFPTTWGEPPERLSAPGIVSVLYSGVGAFYSGCPPGEGTGWTIVGTKTANWSVEDLEPPVVDPRVEMLSQTQAVDAVAADAAFFRRDFESRGPSSRIQFAFQPTGAWCIFQMLTHLDHPDYVATPPKIWGARMQGDGGDVHFIVWTYKPYPKDQRKLIIITLRASVTTFPLLFEAVLSVAREEKLQLIEAWSLDGELDPVVEKTGGRTFERDNHLPAVKWYGTENDVSWVGNNKQVLFAQLFHY